MFSVHSNFNLTVILRVGFGCISDLTSSLELSNVQFWNVFESVEFDVIEFQCGHVDPIAYGKTLGMRPKRSPTTPTGGRSCALLFLSRSTAHVHRQRCSCAAASAQFGVSAPIV